MYVCTFAGVGDHVYVKNDTTGQTRICRVDRMWTDPAGVAYFQGPYYLTPSEVEHGPTRTFYVCLRDHNHSFDIIIDNHGLHVYPVTSPRHLPSLLSLVLQEREVLKSSVEETHRLSSVSGRCVVMAIRDWLTCRFTEIAEKHVFVCESHYVEAEKTIKKFFKASSMIKDKLSLVVCDDEIYFFPSPATLLKVASPALLEVTSRRTPPPPVLDEPEDSNPLPFDDSSNQMDASFSESFVTGFQVGRLSRRQLPSAGRSKVISSISLFFHMFIFYIVLIGYDPGQLRNAGS